MLGTFILDFQTVEFDSDSKVAHEFLDRLQGESQVENAYALDDPVRSAGWSFSKLFLSGEFAEKIHSRHFQEIESTRGKKIEERMTAWLASQLKKSGCNAQLKMAREMKLL